MIFEYDLEYHHMPLKKMSVTHETFWSSDEFPDIKLQSVIDVFFYPGVLGPLGLFVTVPGFLELVNS